MICNAGISIRHDFTAITPAEFDRVMRVNLYGSFYASQHAARAMLAASGGAILFTASTSGVAGYRFYADYNASKGAIIAMMRTMALELAPKVRVNAVNPGYTLTPMQEAEYSPAMLKAVNDAIPMGRHARPAELAGLFAYLASDEAAYATGQVFTLDGGESSGTLAGQLPRSD
jgi:meso-butanediol dehydrogenase / (S,S)-butanediol dehydrogenase / diacetyl reductase